MGKFTEFKLPLKSMPEGTQTFNYHLGKEFFANMESEDIHDADLNVDFTVDHKADIYALSFNIEGIITLICDRCLDNLEYPIDVNYAINVKYGDDYNDDSDDLLIIPEGDNYLNVAYMIYDTVALAIPMKHVHPLGKCNRQMSQMLKKHRATAADDEEVELEERLIEEIDSMPAETDNQPTDPRWDQLKKLAGNDDSTDNG